MVYRSRSADWGGFSKGFAEAFAAMMKLAEDKRYHEAIEAHWLRQDQNASKNNPYANGVFGGAKGGFKEGYNDGAGGGGGGVAGNAGELKDFYVSQGYTSEGASAIVGNWQQENSLKGGGWGGDNGTSAGGFQWHDNPSKGLYRGTGFMNWAKENNLDVNDPMTSARYSIVDIKQHFPELDKYLRTTNNVDEATQKFEKDFEGASDPRMENRLSAARATYNIKSTGKGAEPTTPDGKPAVKTIVSAKEADKPSREATAEEMMTPGGGESFRIPGETDRRAPTVDPASAGAGSPPPAPSPGPDRPPAGDEAYWRHIYESGHGIPPVTASEGRPDTGIPPSPMTPAVTSTEGRPDTRLTGPFRPPGYGPPSLMTPAVTSTEGRPDVPLPPITTSEGRPDVPYTSPGRTGPAEVNVKLASGERDERTTPDSAKPSESAQPVAATKPTPQSRQDNSRFVMVDRPNADPTRRGYEGAPQSTALDLSSLWGPNPPISQRGQAAAASAPAAAAPSRHDDSDTVPPAPDDTNTAGITDEMIMGSRKGGPIRGYARGGAIPTQPTMRYAGGGAAGPGSFGYVAPSVSSRPEFTKADLDARQNVVNQMRTAIPLTPTTTFGDIGNTYGTLTPDQQKWYTDAATAISTANQYPGMGSLIYKQLGDYPATPVPAAATPAPAAATPAPKVVNPTLSTTVTPVTDTTTTDPSTTTGTGIPNVPTSGAIAKSYDPNVDAKTGAGFSNTQSAGGTNYSVGADDSLKKNDQGTISGYARGGALPTRPTMKFAAGGYAAPGQSPGIAYMMSPNYIGPTGNGGWSGSTSYDKLAPNQQAWANTTRSLLDQIRTAGAADAAYWGGGGNDPNGPNPTMQYFNQITPMPDAIWPTAAKPAATPTTPVSPTVTTTVTPVADTTTTDPSTVAGAGTPGVPDVVNPAVDTPAAPIVNPDVSTVTGTPSNPVPKAPKSYDPTVDTTGRDSQSRDTGSTNYGVDPTGGGDFGYSNYNQIQGFDDGGAVNPSAIGMPPGLSGGSSPPPPIYYNGATYSPAGAPVGRGVTQSSVPTYIAGAIPSLPMMRGGIVKRYAEGGDVAADDDVDENTGEVMIGRSNEDVTQGGRSGQPNEFTGDYPSTTPSVSAPPSQPPANLPAWMPQVEDGQGNPSRGLIGAIAGGLHYIASQLGVTGDGQQQGAIANDPSVQANRQSFAQGEGLPGAPMPTHQEVSAIHQSLGLNDGLHEGLANLAGMEAVRNFYLVHGDPQKADQMAASMLQYSVTLSRDYGDQAVKRYYANDLDGATHALVKAKESIADGTLMNAKVNKDANGNPVSVNIEGTDLQGKPLWAKTVGPEAILGAALHTRNGSLAWSLYEIQAARYDPHTADMIKQRQARTQQEEANEQIAGFGPTSTPYEGGGGGGGGAQPPQITPVNVPPAPQPVNRGIPLAPGQTEAGSPPVIGALAPPLPSIGQSGLEASRAQPPSPEQQVVMEGNRGRGPDTTSAQSAAPPPEPTPEPPQVAQQGAGFRPALPGPGAPPEATLGVGAPTRENASNIPTENAQEVAALSPEAEQARYQQIEQTIHAQYRDPKTGGIVLDGQLYQMPQPISQTTYAKMAPQVKQAWDERMKTFRWAASEADKRAASEIDAQRRDYGVSLASQRSGAQMRQQSAMEDRREQARQDAATLAEQRKQEDAIRLEGVKTQLQEHNTDYNANSAGAAPYSPQDMNEIHKTYDPYLEVAKAFNPALVDVKNLTREQAMNDLVQKGFSSNTMTALANAWDNAVMHSRNTSPDEISKAIQGFVNSNYFVANAEYKDSKGNPLPLHGAVRYDVTVEDNAGIPITFRIAAPALAQLRGLQQQYGRQRQENLARQVSTRDLATLVDNPTETGIPPQVIMPGEGTVEQQTQQPPF